VVAARLAAEQEAQVLMAVDFGECVRLVLMLLLLLLLLVVVLACVRA
jgi:hypothetical protein